MASQSILVLPAHILHFLPFSPGKLGGQDSFESIESYDSCDRLTQSWSSQSSFQSLQRVPSYDSFDSEDYPAALPNHKPKGTFKDYVRDRADMNKDKPVIPAAALAGYTGRVTLLKKHLFAECRTLGRASEVSGLLSIFIAGSVVCELEVLGACGHI